MEDFGPVRVPFGTQRAMEVAEPCSPTGRGREHAAEPRPELSNPEGAESGGGAQASMGSTLVRVVRPPVLMMGAPTLQEKPA